MFWWKKQIFQTNENVKCKPRCLKRWRHWMVIVVQKCLCCCFFFFCFSTFDNICLQLLQVSSYLHQPGAAYHMSVCTHLCPLQSVSSTLQQPPQCRCFILLELQIFGPVCIIIISGVVIIDGHFRQKHSLNLLLVCNIQPQILEYLL